MGAGAGAAELGHALPVPVPAGSREASHLVRDTVEQRANRGSLSDLDDILANVPDVPPVAGDEK